MDPQTAKKLMSEIPEMKEFVDFVKQEVRSLDTVQGIDLTNPTEIATEILARQRAIQVLVKILTPLVDIQDFTAVDKDEFVV